MPADMVRQVEDLINRGYADMKDSSYAEIIVAVGDQLSTATVLIGTGTSLSPGVDLGIYRIARMTIPATWTTADITFQTSDDGQTWNNLYDSSGLEYKVITGTAPRAIILPASDLLAVRYVKIRSGTSASPVTQTADASIVLTVLR